MLDVSHFIGGNATERLDKWHSKMFAKNSHITLKLKLEYLSIANNILSYNY